MWARQTVTGGREFLGAWSHSWAAVTWSRSSPWAGSQCWPVFTHGHFSLLYRLHLWAAVTGQHGWLSVGGVSGVRESFRVTARAHTYTRDHCDMASMRHCAQRSSRHSVRGSSGRIPRWMRCSGRYVVMYAVNTSRIANGGTMIGGTRHVDLPLFPHPRGTESQLPTTSRHSATGHPPVFTGRHIAAPRAVIHYHNKSWLQVQ